jgi:hypothetical protein
MELGKFADDGCNEECSYDKQCLRRADWYEAYKLRQEFWGAPTDAPYMPKKRLSQIMNIFTICHAVQVGFSFLPLRLCLSCLMLSKSFHSTTGQIGPYSKWRAKKR